MKTAGNSVEDLISALPAIFTITNWSFSPEKLLTEERDRVEAGLVVDHSADLLSIAPGKQMLPIAARSAGLQLTDYVGLVCSALAGSAVEPSALAVALESALAPHLPARYAAVVTGVSNPT